MSVPEFSRDYVATANFAGPQSRFLSFSKGDVITVIARHQNSWFTGRFGDRVGFVSGQCLQAASSATQSTHLAAFPRLAELLQAPATSFVSSSSQPVRKPPCLIKRQESLSALSSSRPAPPPLPSLPPVKAQQEADEAGRIKAGQEAAEAARAAVAAAAEARAVEAERGRVEQEAIVAEAERVRDEQAAAIVAAAEAAELLKAEQEAAAAAQVIAEQKDADDSESSFSSSSALPTPSTSNETLAASTSQSGLNKTWSSNSKILGVAGVSYAAPAETGAIFDVNQDGASSAIIELTSSLKESVVSQQKQLDSAEESRRRQEAVRVKEAIDLLVRHIQRVAMLPDGGWSNADASISVPYGRLFSETQQEFEALFGTLKAARKQSTVQFTGDLLLMPRDEFVEIKLLPVHVTARPSRAAPIGAAPARPLAMSSPIPASGTSGQGSHDPLLSKQRFTKPSLFAQASIDIPALPPPLPLAAS
ncbi:MAG: SH3 domain-containing protein, partial [archaeon]|nr:SH3 domain-containing protein [archaeon]